MFEKGFLNLAEAAVRLGVSERTVRNRIARGEIPAEKVSIGKGWAWRIPEDALEVSEVVSEPISEKKVVSEVVSEPISSLISETVTEVSERLTVLQNGVDTRLSRIEGVLAGQFISDITKQLSELAASNDQLKRELQETREELRQREKAAVQREAELLTRLGSIERTLQRKPWWRWFLLPSKKGSR